MSPPLSETQCHLHSQSTDVSGIGDGASGMKSSSSSESESLTQCHFHSQSLPVDEGLCVELAVDDELGNEVEVIVAA